MGAAGKSRLFNFQQSQVLPATNQQTNKSFGSIYSVEFPLGPILNRGASHLTLPEPSTVESPEKKKKKKKKKKKQHNTEHSDSVVESI
ncbi:hypothetical protein Ahy_B07g088873 isoform A [Arachis hypogaea]|uniref:Uncharacterized protein n=1 Tax=Arachis hypogaea TaxID=3818 RepID=A0A444YFR2_ARAHY|nr:hypothetical protein Ahy_B07g088873 isoform A [Arachis hypogaea]